MIFYIMKYIPAILFSIALIILLVISSRYKADYSQSRIRQGMDEFYKSDSMLKAKNKPAK